MPLDAAPPSMNDAWTWYAVPWGASPAGPDLLRLSLRMMAEQVGSAENTALHDWPAFMAGLESASVALEHPAGTAQVPTRPGRAYRRYLESIGLDLAQASALWRAIFGDQSEALQRRGARAAAPTPQPPTNYRWRHSTAALVEAANERFALVYGNDFNRIVQQAARRAEPGEPVLVRPEPPSPTVREQLARAASLYTRPGEPNPSLEDHIARIRARRQAGAGAQPPQIAFDPWSEHILRAEATQSARGVASSAAPVMARSHTHVDFLLRHGGSATAKAHAIAGRDTERLDEFAIHLLSRRRMYADAGRGAVNKAAQIDPGTQFLTRLAALAVHPWLCRVLGLVVGIDVPSPVALDKVRRVAVRPPAGTAGAGAAPWTVLDNGYPASYRPGARDYRQGLLNMPGPAPGRFMLTQFDADRSPERYMQAALGFRSRHMAGLEHGPAAVELQGQESVGYSVIETSDGRRRRLLERDRHGDLYLEHLLAGYRPDVKDMSRPERGWQSLTAQRLKSVRLAGRDITHWFARIGRTEAFSVDRARLTETDKGQEAEIDDELFRWTMHSIPDATRGRLRDQLTIGDTGGTAAVHGLDIAYQGLALPEQRVGRAYRFGVRLAMVDGNSLDLATAAQRYDDATAPPLTLGGPTGQVCQRFEPLAAPTPLLTDRPERVRFPKDGPQHIVVTRSGHRRAERVLVPPRAGVDLCLRLGALDHFRGSTGWPPSAFPGIHLQPDGDFPTVTSKWADADGKPREAHDRIYRRRETVGAGPVVPYYPDPWARQAVCGLFRKGDDLLLGTYRLDYYGAANRWPDCRPLAIAVQAVDRVADRDAGFDVEVKGTQLLISVAPGAELTVRVWHRLDRKQMDLMAPFVQYAAHSTGRALAGSLLSVLAGDDGSAPRDSSSWMLNPFIELAVVHAVERPVQAAEPSPGTLQLERQPGATSATSTGRILLDRRSTGRITAQAAWVDLGTSIVRHDERSYRRPAVWRNGELFNMRSIAIVAADDKGAPAVKPMERKREDFQYYQDIGAQLAVPPTTGSILESRRRLTGEFDFGDTRARWVDVTTSAESRHVDEFARLDRNAAWRKSAVAPVMVAATASPPPPVIDYIIPLLLSEERTSLQDDLLRVRHEGWFRIWLKGSWYDSGNGELLAMAILPEATSQPRMNTLRTMFGLATRGQVAPPGLEPLVTQWGLDPLVAQDIEFGALPLSALRNRMTSLSGLRHSGERAEVLDIDQRHLAGMTDFAPRVHLRHTDAYRATDFGDGLDADLVELALFRPVLDEASGAMYVDVHIDPAYAYQPFVRLALARYQHHAYRKDDLDLRLSTIVATEFVQLMPGRIATLSSERDRRGRVTGVRVAVHGTTIPRSSRAALKTVLLVTIEERVLNFAEGFDDGVNGAWIPVPGSGEDHSLDPDTLGRSWSATIPLSTRTAREYSVRIEEYEMGVQSGADSSARRLVFFDRLPLRRI